MVVTFKASVLELAFILVIFATSDVFAFEAELAPLDLLSHFGGSNLLS